MKRNPELLKKNKNVKERKLSFYAKEVTVCSVCSCQFYHEELYTGRGRLIADVLTPELRRTYSPTKMFGKVYPLAYELFVCPNCYVATMPGDLEMITPEQAGKLRADTKRADVLNLIHEEVDFRNPRSLSSGLVSYILALYSYDYFGNNACPVIKQGICALRGAWLANSMHEEYPKENYNYLALFLYRKACYFYNRALQLDSGRKQPLHDVAHLGPDIDKNYAFDGLVYIQTVLNFYYGQTHDKQKRLETLKTIRISLSKMFGIGRASKSKPSAVLNYARELHDALIKEIEKLEMSIMHA